MVNLNDGFNLHVLNKVDGRKVAEIRRATNDHDGTISILRFRKKSDVPNIILDFQMTEEDSFILQFEHLSTDEIMDLYTKFCDLLDDYILADPATSQDIVEFFQTLKDLYNDEKPKLSAPKDYPQLGTADSEPPLTPMDPEEIAKLMEKAFDDLEPSDLEKLMKEAEEEEGKPDMDEDQRFTADFFDFCEKGKLHFFRLLQMVDYLNVIKDASPVELNKFNYLAYISLCFRYDEIKGTKDDLTPSTRLWVEFYETTKRVIGQAIGDYSIITTIQSLMETLEGYKNREWTADDVEHIDEMLESLDGTANAEGIEIVFNKKLPNKDELTFFIANNGLSHLISELFGEYSGTLDLDDLILFNNSEYKEDATAKGFLYFLNELPNFTNSKFKKNENSN